MAGLNLQSLISMGTQAMQLMGKNGNMLSLAGKAAQVWKEYQKYPQTPEGLRQAMAAHNIDAETIRKALNNLNPQLRKFIDDKLPGSLNLLSNMANTSGSQSQASHNPGIESLLQKAKRR